MVPLLEGKEGCTCDMVTTNKKSRFLIFGSKRDDRYYVTHVAEFQSKDKGFRKALKAIRNGKVCRHIMQGSGLGLQPDPSPNGQGKGKGKGKKGKKRKKGKKGKKGDRQGDKKGGKRRGKKGKKGGRKKKNGSNEQTDESSDVAA